MIFHVPALMFITGCLKVTNDETAVQGFAVGRGTALNIYIPKGALPALPAERHERGIWIACMSIGMYLDK